MTDPTATSVPTERDSAPATAADEALPIDCISEFQPVGWFWEGHVGYFAEGTE